MAVRCSEPGGARYNASMGLRMVAIVGGLAAAVLATGCATARASAPAPLPLLTPPDAPPRVVAEYLPDPPLPAEPVAAEAVTPVARPTRPARREPVRTDPAAEPPGPASVPVPAAPQPALTMQNAGANARADQSVRSLLGQASRDLERVVYQTLDADGRAQYDTARRFMQQADEALRARNVVFAGKLADKAAAMASVLVR
jgi:hypothetical protein